MSKECEMIKDLLPLYVDEICSEESKNVVEKHIESCESCKALLEKLNSKVELPIETDIEDVKGFKRFVNKKIWTRVLVIAIVLVVFLFIANYLLINRWKEIWPKVDEEGVLQELEVVTLDNALFLHQSELFGFGEIIVISSDEEFDNGIIKFYLGEQGINTLDPTGHYRAWIMEETYKKFPGQEETTINKIIYCHKNGEEVAVLWGRRQ